MFYNVGPNLAPCAPSTRNAHSPVREVFMGNRRGRNHTQRIRRVYSIVKTICLVLGECYLLLLCRLRQPLEESIVVGRIGGIFCSSTLVLLAHDSQIGEIRAFLVSILRPKCDCGMVQVFSCGLP